MASILSNSFLLLLNLFWWWIYYHKPLSQLRVTYRCPQCGYVRRVFHSKTSYLWELLLLGHPLVGSVDTPLVHCEVGLTYCHRLIQYLSTVRWGRCITFGKCTTYPLRGGADTLPWTIARRWTYHLSTMRWGQYIHFT